jgi:predicted DNA-binding mobile mystery protein A
MDKIIRRQLDKQLILIGNSLNGISLPSIGWIKTIRQALKMSSRQLGKKLNLSQQRISQLEQAEVDGSATINSIKEAANALGCKFVYALIPNKPLENIYEEQIYRLARKKLEYIVHSMALEDQRVDDEEIKQQLKDLVEELKNKPTKELWE